MIKRYKNQRVKRQNRIRAKINGTNLIPRLSIFRSNKFTYAQLIDDEKGKTLVHVQETSLEEKELKDQNKTQIAKLLGLNIGKQAIEKGIKKVVFDRGGYRYHGRVKAVAEGARESGLEF